MSNVIILHPRLPLMWMYKTKKYVCYQNSVLTFSANIYIYIYRYSITPNYYHRILLFVIHTKTISGPRGTIEFCHFTAWDRLLKQKPPYTRLIRDPRFFRFPLCCNVADQDQRPNYYNEVVYDKWLKRLI